MNILHNIQQGSNEWLEIRKLHFTASEACCVLGKSKYLSRVELLKQKHSGITPDVDAHTQARFDKGHVAEDSARGIAERIVGQDLFPITATLDVDDLPLLASFDGISVDDEIIWEHKLWSKNLADDIAKGNIDPHYTIQLDQQLLISGAKKCLFMASDGTEENLAWCWYEPNQEKFDALIAGWRQFRIDLAAYVPQAIPEKPEAAPIMQLPALAIQIRGEVTSSNLKQYREAAEQFIAGIKTDLQTDEDFANAEETVKFCDKAEKELELTKKAAIAQTASIDELMRTIDHIKDQLRDKRLMLDKLVKTQKEAIKSEIVSKAKTAFADHVAVLDAEIKPIRLAVQQPDLLGAIKNKRTLASLHDSVDTTLANAKIAADATAKDIRAKLAWHKENAKGYEFLFADLQQIIQKPAEDFQMLVQNRIAQHKLDEQRKLEAERARIQAEEQRKAQAKIEAEARAKAEEEARAKATAEHNARVEAEKAARVAAAQAAPAQAATEAPKPVLVKSEAKPAISPALIGLARRDLSFIRGKYESIPELSGVMREIDLFLAAAAPEARRA